MGSQLFQLPKAVPLDSNAELYAGAKAYFYVTGTSTPQDTYQDANLTIPHAHPVVADGFGRFPVVYLDPTKAYKLTMTTAAGVALPDFADPVNDQILSGAAIGAFIFPKTTAETTASITPTNYSYPEKNVLRYGIVPNDATKRAQNDAAIRALVNSDSVGPTGYIEFPNTTGSDTYYFSDFFPSRDGLIFSGNFVTIDIAKTYTASDDSTGFFYFIRNGGIENLDINVDYDGSAGVHAGNVITIGQRNNAGNYFQFGDENVLATPMGRVFVRNVRITTNNPVNDGAVLMFGGLRDVVFENVVINGSNACSYGILYEYGFYDQAASPDVSSHATNLIFRNVRISNLDDTSFGEGAGIALIGAYSFIVENLHVDTAYHCFESRPGEALNYNVAPYDTPGVKRCMTLRNIVGKNIANSGLVLIGAESASGGYLSGTISGLGHPADYLAQQTLGMFSVDGFSFPDAQIGVSCSGPLSLSNGYLSGFSSSGAIVLAPECGAIDIHDVRIFDGAGSAIQIASRVITGSTTTLRGRISGLKVGGCTGPGISLADTDGLTIDACDLGYATALGDVANESTMTSGINLAASAKHVRCIGNYIRPTGGVAYGSASGVGDRGNDIIGPRGDSTHTGSGYMLDGISRAQDTAIADDANIINTENKYIGKKVFDTSNNRILYALGSATTSAWAVCDGSGTVTPS